MAGSKTKKTAIGQVYTAGIAMNDPNKVQVVIVPDRAWLVSQQQKKDKQIADWSIYDKGITVVMDKAEAMKYMKVFPHFQKSATTALVDHGEHIILDQYPDAGKVEIYKDPVVGYSMVWNGIQFDPNGNKVPFSESFNHPDSSPDLMVSNMLTTLRQESENNKKLEAAKKFGQKGYTKDQILQILAQAGQQDTWMGPGNGSTDETGK